MDIDFNVEIEDDGSADEDLEDEGQEDEIIVAMPELGSITTLREKLHARMVALRRGGQGDAEAGDRDELLEERRRQRAVMREKRRKETKEKIKREEEAKGRKGKAKEKDSRAQGHQTKVCFRLMNLSVGYIMLISLHRPNSSYPTNRQRRNLHTARIIPTSLSPPSPAPPLHLPRKCNLSRYHLIPLRPSNN